MPSVFVSSISVIVGVAAASCVGSAERGGTWRGISCLEPQSTASKQQH